MIVVDASVLIALFDKTDALHIRARDLLAEAPGEALAVSALTFAEIMVLPARSNAVAKATRALDDLDISVISIDRAAAIQLAGIRARTGLKLPDCCVVLAAHQEGAELATFDDQLGIAARTEGLTVRR